MYYISSKKDNRFGVTDTKDNVEELYREDEIAYFIRDKGLSIEGAYVFNHKADCTVLHPFKCLSKTVLLSLLKAWKELHNPWTGYPVQWYLAEAEVGTRITVDYHDKSYKGRSELVKLSIDEWKFIDTGNTASGDIGNHAFAAWALEVACIYNKVDSLRIE